MLAIIYKGSHLYTGIHIPVVVDLTEDISRSIKLIMLTELVTHSQLVHTYRAKSLKCKG
jgi:hypothetical protein